MLTGQKRSSASNKNYVNSRNKERVIVCERGKYWAERERKEKKRERKRQRQKVKNRDRE